MTMPPEALLARAEFPAVAIGISCFSTLGCPEFSLSEAAALAREFDLSCLELRALENRTDLPDLLSRFPGGWAGAHHFLQEQGLRVQVLGSSCKLIDPAEGQWEELLAMARLADALAVSWVRVFSGGVWGKSLTAHDYRQAVSSLHRWRREKEIHGWNVDLLVETHDAFSASAPCIRLLEMVGGSLEFLWDSHHTWRLGGESPVETWAALAPRVRHVHLKDSIGVPSARHPFTYVAPGEGEMPVSEVLEILSRDGFSGTVSLEWEKLWHPYLPPLPQALHACQRKGWL